MKIYLAKSFLIVFSLLHLAKAQSLTKQVNVFLGSSGDHGQLSPALRY